MKNKTLLLLAILLGALAFIMNTRYLRNEKAKLYQGAVKIQVLAAARDLPAGTELKTSGENADIGIITVYKSAVGDNVLLPADLNRITGKKLRYTLKRKEPVWWSHVDMPRNERTGLSSKIQYDSMGTSDNYRALSVPISGAAAVSGMIKPGDYVDILGTFSMPSKLNPQLTEKVTSTLFPKVKVLAVGNKTNESDMMRSSSGGSITFEVEPEVAEIIVFAQHSGQLYLTLRHPDNPDTSTPGVRIDFDTLESLLPQVNSSRKYNN